METNETYFLRELEHLKTSADSNFRHLYYVIRPWSVSLPMIILHLKDIIKALLRFLDQTKPELVPAVLSLIGILARDMRSEFYPYFDIVLQCCIAKIDEWRTMPDQLEALFTTIARAFKFLERYLLKDLKSVFLLYKDFFLTRKEHVRQFAAESFAYLLRKLSISKLNEMVDFMLSQLPLPVDDEEAETQREELADGIGFLLFYVVQGIKGKLTTNSIEIVPLVFSKLGLRPYVLDNDMDVDGEENADGEKMPTLHLKAKSVLATNVVEESLDSRYLVLARFVKSIRAHYHNDDCPLLWEAFTKLFASIFADNEDISRDQFRTVGYTYSLVADYIHNRHLPNMVVESQKGFLDRALAFLSIPKAACGLPSPPVPMGASYTREALERLAIDYAVPLFEMASNDHTSVANAVRKEVRTSLDRLLVLLDAHHSIAYRFAIGLKHTSLFKHYLLPLILQFVDKQLKRVESANSSASPHPAVKDALWFVYTLASDLDWGTMLGAANLNVANNTIQFPSDKLASHCLTLLSDLKPAYFEDATHLATMWMAVCTVSFIQVNSAEIVSSLDAALSSFLECLLQKNSKFKRMTLPQNTRDLLIGQALTTRCQLAKSSGARHPETSLELLKTVLTETMELLQQDMGQAKRHLIQAFADMVQLAVMQPYGDPMRYQEARDLLKSRSDFLKTLLDAIGVLTSHFNVMVRRSSWTLLKSLAELDDDLPIFTDLAVRCEAIANKHINPLEHRDISSQFADVVELALKPSAGAFDRSLAIRFLIGILFVQLTPLWQPAIKSLARLHDVDSKTFWQVSLPLLASAQAQIGHSDDKESSHPTATSATSTDDAMAVDEDESITDAATSIFLNRADPPSIEALFEDLCVDSFRFTGASAFSDSLWSALAHGGRALPPASGTAAIIWDGFLKFISDHFPYIDDPTRMHIFSQSTGPAPSAEKKDPNSETNSKKDSKKSPKKSKSADDDDEEMPELESVADSPLSRAAVGEIRKFLLHFLKFFGNFKNTLDVKKASELYAVFEKLVALANTDIQLASLQCMSLFKQGDYIVPYKPHFDAMIQDSRARTPFTEFPLLPAKSAILPEHRPLVIPLMIRILYPKLTLTRFDAGRRSAVLAYLAQCDSAELGPLLELTLGSSLRCIESLPLPTPATAAATPSKKSRSQKSGGVITVSQIELPSVLSLGQLVGSSKMVGDMVKSMGVSVLHFLPKLLTLSMWYLHLAQETTALTVSEGNFSASRMKLTQANQIRKNAIRNLISILSFFDAYDYAPFKTEMLRMMEVDAKSALGLAILPDTATFLDWAVAVSSHPRIISMLKDFIPYIVALLKPDYMTLNVRSKLFTIIENLLRVRDEDKYADDKERNESLKKTAALIASTKGGKAATYNPGEIVAGLTAKQRSKMDPTELHTHMTQYALTLEYRAQEDVLMPYSNDILDAMQMRLFADHAAKRRVGKRELIILEKLCRYATTSEHADKLGSLILPFAKQKGFHPETRQRILSVFANLIPLMSEALVHTEAVKVLFTDMKDLKCRAELGRIFLLLAKLDPALTEIGPHIEALNSMNPLQIDEPDYERRMEAYTEINERLIKKLAVHPISFILANYLFFLSHEDLSIRNNAAFGITQLVRRIAAQFEPGAEKTKSKSIKDLPLVLVTETIFNQIKRQLHSPSELSRREHLSLLSVVVETMPVQFADLVPALGADDDSNFFLCIHHLQTYRRSRILTKLAVLIRADKFPKSALLTVFFPVIKQLILSATHKQHAVVDEAIKATAAIAEKLDWRSYWGIVQATLKGMEANKDIQNQWIKLLCTVLDTFHFDISKVFDDIVQETKPKKKSFKITSEQDNFDEDQVEAQIEAQAQKSAQAAAEEEEEDDAAADDDKDEAGAETDSNPNTDDEAEGAEEKEEGGEETDSNPDTDQEGETSDPTPELEQLPATSGSTNGINYRDMAPEDLLQRQIQRTVVKSLLPTLLRLMKSGNTDEKIKYADRAPSGDKEKEERTVLRTNVVVCAVRLLNLLPDAMSHTHISMFVIEVTNQLASRAHVNRLAASISIQEILKILGPTKFLFLLDILVAQLRRGFQLHILCHTVHNLLKALQPLVKPGEIDEGIHMLNKIFFEELIGKVAEQKSVSKIVSAIGSEAKGTWAFESLGILAQLIDFDKSVRPLLNPYIDVILATTDVKVIKKMRQAIDQVSIGVRSNASVTSEKLCVFVYQLIDQYYSQKKALSGDETMPKSDLERTWIVEANPYKQGTYAAAAQITGKEVDNDHIVVAYALQLLFSLVKSSRLSPKDPHHLALLDPFVGVLARNLRGRKDDVLSISVRCLTALLKYPLPSIDGRAGMLAEATIHLLQKANMTSELFRMCFKALARVLIITGSKKLKNVPDTLWSIVIGYISETLETDTPQHALELFKAMVGKRIILAEMYDVMKRINQLLVQTRLSNIRGMCEQIIASFILTYPLEAKRFEQQLEFVMANLTFPESNGRLAIMELLKSLFQRFPEELLNKHVQYFFLPLVAQMVNDEFAENRSAASRAIEVLYARVSKDNSDHLLQTALKWYEDDAGKTSLQRAAAQLIMVFAGKLGAESYTPVAKRLLPTFLKRMEQVTDDYEDDEDLANFVHVSDEQWQGVYFTLLAVEKTLTVVPSMTLKSNLVPLWRRIASPQILSFPHAWVRLVAARLLGTYFNARKESMPIRPASADATPSKKNNAANADWLAEPRRLFSMAQLFCEMFTAPDLSDELGTQVVKDLYWITLQLQAFPDLTPPQQIQAAFLQGDDQIESADEREDDGEDDEVKPKNKFYSSMGASDDENGDDKDEDDSKNAMDVDSDAEEMPALKQLKKRSNGSSDKSEDAPATEDDRARDSGVPSVNWVLRRCSYMTKTLSRLGKSCIFKFFAAISMTMEVQEVKDYLVFMLFPLFRVNEMIQNRAEKNRHAERPVHDTPESIEFAEIVDQVATLLRKKVGTTYYFEIHERVRSRILHVRQKRKSELAIEAVINPGKSALRKVRKHEKSKESKKRKIEGHMAHRTTHRLKMKKF